ncbi:unnamed protein product [Cunninghamella echinulata]
MVTKFLLCGLLLVPAVQLQNTNGSTTTLSKTCDSPIYCEGPLLKTVQLAGLFPDSKTFVDMPTTKPLDQVLQAFDALGSNPDKNAIQTFVNENFGEAGTEIQPYNITTPPLTWLDSINDSTYRGWIDILHHRWSQLTFHFNTDSLCDGCVTSTLPVKRPFVVPGGRFREFYYWDSYFVIRGLLLSDMDSLARGMIENFLDFVDTYGFMPNGARIYYLNRSQPPFLTRMINIYYEKTKDKEFLKKALPTLEKEYKYWMDKSTVTIEQGHKKYKLNRYYVQNQSPRPESYREDYNTVLNGTDFTSKQQSDLFSDLAAGAESGWDYTARWTNVKESEPDSDILRTLNTRNVIPVELNALLWDMETTIASWLEECGDDTNKKNRRKIKYFQKQAKKRLEAMEILLWNDESSSFNDYNITSHAQNEDFSAASLFPFWLGAVPESVREPSVLNKVFDQTIQVLKDYPGVLAMTLHNTTLQWDLPNGWPPLQYVAMNAMINVDKWLGVPKFSYLAKTLAQRNAASAFCSWYFTGGSVPGELQKLDGIKDDGHMFEKFDIRSMTESGSGGEYTVQVGFGWTNGVTLWALNNFNDMKAPNCNATGIYQVPESF